MMTGSTSMDLATNVFKKKKVSLKILYDTVDGTKTNPRIVKPGVSLGGLKFNFDIWSAENDATIEEDGYEYALVLKLSEAEKQRLADGYEVSVRYGEVSLFDDDKIIDSDEASETFSPLWQVEHLRFTSATNRYEALVELKIEDVFPHRLQFVDAEVAKEKMNDCKLILVDDEEKAVYVNKTILASRSPFFKTLFFGDFTEKNQEEIKLRDVEMDDFLEYLYCAYPLPFRPFAFKRIESLLRLADRYQNDSLMEAIEKFLMEKKDKTSKEKQKTLVWSDAYNMTALFRNTLKTMSEAELKKIGSKIYKLFKRQHIELLVARLSGDF